VKHFYTNLSVAILIYRWGAGVAVTGPICDIGQNVFTVCFDQEKAVAAAAAQLLPHFVTFRFL
jgi:hypothetical protein